MGTRGLIGFVVDGVEKLTYSHWGSSPESNGLVMLRFARSILTDGDAFGRTVVVKPDVLEKVRQLQLVDQDDRPTNEQQERLVEHADFTVSTGQPDEWYALLRNLQGDPQGYLDAGFMIDSAGFAADSLFNEGSYLIDFDENVYEAYDGFIRAPHDDGRFADMEPSKNHDGVVEYYPIRLIGRWSLSALPTDEEFLKHCDPDEDEES